MDSSTDDYAYECVCKAPFILTDEGIGPYLVDFRAYWIISAALYFRVLLFWYLHCNGLIPQNTQIRGTKDSECNDYIT